MANDGERLKKENGDYKDFLSQQHEPKSKEFMSSGMREVVHSTRTQQNVEYTKEQREPIDKLKLELKYKKMVIMEL